MKNQKQTKIMSKMKKVEKRKLQLATLKQGVSSIKSAIDQMEDLDERWHNSVKSNNISDYRFGRWLEMMNRIERNINDLEYDFMTILPTQQEQEDYSYMNEPDLVFMDGFETYYDYYPDEILSDTKVSLEMKKEVGFF